MKSRRRTLSTRSKKIKEKAIVRRAPNHTINKISEVVHNLNRGYYPLTQPQYNRLKKSAPTLVKFSQSHRNFPVKRRRRALNQKGGNIIKDLIGVVPAVLGLLGLA